MRLHGIYASKTPPGLTGRSAGLGRRNRLCKSAVIQLLCVTVILGCAPAASAERIATGLFGLWAWHDWDQALKIVKDNGFDLVVGMTEKSELDKEARVGIKALVGLGLTKRVADDEGNWLKYLESVREQVSELKHHPSLFAWYIVDEPDLSGIPPEKVGAVCEVVRSVDGRTPLFTVLASPTKWSPYLRYFDIVAIDPYLARRPLGLTEKPEKVRRWIAMLRDDLKRANLERPVWVVLGAFELKARDPTVKPPAFYKPTPAEFNEMVGIAVQERVGGILVFTLAKKGEPSHLDLNLPNDDPALWEAVRKMPGTVRRYGE